MSDQPPEMPYVNHQFDGERLASDLCKVPDEAALSVAIFFEDAALKMRERHQIWQREQEIRKKSISNRSSLTRLPGRMLDQMLNGHSFEIAAQTIADQHNVPRETAYKYWLAAVSEIENKSKHKRNLKIIELYKDGKSDAVIADTVNLSERQVRRIIRTSKNFP